MDRTGARNTPTEVEDRALDALARAARRAGEITGGTQPASSPPQASPPGGTPKDRGRPTGRRPWRCREPGDGHTQGRGRCTERIKDPRRPTARSRQVPREPGRVGDRARCGHPGRLFTNSPPRPARRRPIRQSRRRPIHQSRGPPNHQPRGRPIRQSRRRPIYQSRGRRRGGPRPHGGRRGEVRMGPMAVTGARSGGCGRADRGARDGPFPRIVGPASSRGDGRPFAARSVDRPINEARAGHVRQLPSRRRTHHHIGPRAAPTDHHDESPEFVGHLVGKRRRIDRSQ